ncbi:hypothetical protein FDP22_00115 [Paroceanicella profunda]|uniref:HAD family hydrolase n=1 Tax=Paroceanicella profunda TaxID=2579971 RepID=A0A5B8FTH0_9RHOB|nr:hypothetical protein [Paroceanicella profunda]QDL90340.1 hypothetical protein FDP22_00115 [Paroceanicella profunda]
MTLDAALHSEIRDLRLDADRPLLIVDADEVLIHFAEHLTRWLAAQGWVLRLTEYRLDGAIRHAQTGQAPGAFQLRELLDGFIDSETRQQLAVTGAAEALAALSREMQVVVLTNVPARARADRVANLAGLGMDYPLLANAGPKGPALAALARRMSAPVAFVDDSPLQIESAARLAASVRRIHFSGSEMLRTILPPVPQAHHAALSWEEIATLLRA